MSDAWDIRPGEGVGALHFGMSEAEVVGVLGEFSGPVRVTGEQRVGIFESGPVFGVTLGVKGLVVLDFDPIGLSHLVYQGGDLAQMQTLDVVRLFTTNNSYVDRCQGGSLYFEKLMLAILSFETSAARSVLMWSDPSLQNEALGRTTLEHAMAFRAEQRADEWPETDLFCEDQA